MADDANDNAPVPEGAGEQPQGGERAGPPSYMVQVVNLKEAREKAKKKRRGWDDVDRLVETFNRRYCVTNDGGLTVVFEERADPVRRGRYVLFKYTFADFQKRYNNRLLTITIERSNKKGVMEEVDITKTLANWWLNSPNRREALAGVCFDPTNSVGKGWWNLWNGFAVTPWRGSWRLMQEHCYHVICRGNREHYDFLLNTAARMIQHPELPAEVAVVLKGDEGTGKGIFLHALREIFGGHGLYLSNPDHLRGRFNEQLQNTIMLFCDEAFYAGDRAHESILKALVTEHELSIEPKNRKLFMTNNNLHIYMASNLNWVVPAALRARRWFLLEVLDTHVDDKPYFDAILREKLTGGLAAMLFDLQRRDLSSFNPRRVPVTDALLEQKVLSLDALHRWLITVLARGFWYRSKYGVKSLSEWHEFAIFEFLTASYQQWCSDHGLYMRQSEAEMGTLLHKMFQHTRRRSLFPVFEVAALPPGRQGGGAPVVSDPDQYALMVDDVQNGSVDGSAPVDAAVGGDWLEEVAVVRASRKWGYFFGSLEEARVKLAEEAGIRMPWEDGQEGQE
jgi:hypothetical protein